MAVMSAKKLFSNGFTAGKRRRSGTSSDTNSSAQSSQRSFIKRSNSLSSISLPSQSPLSLRASRSHFGTPTNSLSFLNLMQPSYASSSSSSSATSDSSIGDPSLVFLALEMYRYIKKRRKKRKTRRKLFTSASDTLGTAVCFQDIVRALGPEKFKISYRMSLPTFKLLLNEVRDLLQKPYKSKTEYRRCTVSPEIRLAITLRILGGGSYVDLILACRLQEATVRRVFHDTCDALFSRLRLKGFPTTIEGMKEIARRFQTSRRGTNPLPGCVGALDDICVKIKKPKRHENPAMFYCRKGFYAVPVQALVDSDYIFRFCYAVCTGATHDALAYSVSGLKREIDRGALFDCFYIVGDDAYTLSKYVITPYCKSNADMDQDNFNFFQSSLRMHVEQAFGMLVSRWRILRGGLQLSVERSTKIICLLMKLHNFILENDSSRSFLVHYLSDAERGILESNINQWCRDSSQLAREFQNRDRNQPRDHDGILEPVREPVEYERRDQLLDIVKRRGRERPNVALIPYETARDPF